jgi:uncharacterized protein (UPF0262 family)
MTMHICKIDIDTSGMPAPTPEIEQERKRRGVRPAGEQHLRPAGPRRAQRAAGPYRLTLAIREKRLVFDVDTEAGEDAAEFHLSLSPFRQVVKDYWQICESYYDAVKNLPPSKIEAIDMARRGIHNEGARILEERLEGKAEVDTDTAGASSP